MDLGCEGEVPQPRKVALDADRLKVHGLAFLSDGFKADGAVSLDAATIGHFLFWRDLIAPENVTLVLRSARIGALT